MCGGPKLKCTTPQHGDARHIIMNPIERTSPERSTTRDKRAPPHDGSSHRRRAASSSIGITNSYRAVPWWMIPRPVLSPLQDCYDAHRPSASRGMCEESTELPSPGPTKRIATYSVPSEVTADTLDGRSLACASAASPPSYWSLASAVRPRRAAPSFPRPRLGRPRTPGTAPRDRRIPRLASRARGVPGRSPR